MSETDTPAGAPGDQAMAAAQPVERSEDWKALRAEEGLSAWSDEDITWLERIRPEIMRPVAKRYGRPCMDLVIRGGVIGHGFERLQASRPPPAMQATLTIMGLHINYLMERALVAAGVSPQLFTSCQEDLDRLAALQSPAGAVPGERKSGGGIILAH